MLVTLAGTQVEIHSRNRLDHSSCCVANIRTSREMPFKVGDRVTVKASHFDEPTGPKWSQFHYHDAWKTARTPGTILQAAGRGKWLVHFDVDGDELEIGYKKLQHKINVSRAIATSPLQIPHSCLVSRRRKKPLTMMSQTKLPLSNPQIVTVKTISKCLTSRRQTRLTWFVFTTLIGDGVLALSRTFASTPLGPHRSLASQCPPKRHWMRSFSTSFPSLSNKWLGI